MSDATDIVRELQSGACIMYVGMGIFEQCRFDDGSQIPSSSDETILAMNDQRPMAPRLMYEYTRAAMSIEQSRGRKYLEQKIHAIYTKRFAPCKTYELIEKIKPMYLIDTNYDTTTLHFYADVPHSVIYGKSRIGAQYDRFEIFEYDPESKKYERIDKEFLKCDMPIIFKPMGCVAPESSLIISDADFVDWLTEAMGGFAVPPVLKEFRQNKKYLFLGLSFAKDTERMVANELTIDLAGGYFVSDKEPVKNCAKFLSTHHIDAIYENVDSFVESLLNVL